VGSCSVVRICNIICNIPFSEQNIVFKYSIMRSSYCLQIFFFIFKSTIFIFSSTWFILQLVLFVRAFGLIYYYDISSSALYTNYLILACVEQLLGGSICMYYSSTEATALVGLKLVVIKEYGQMRHIATDIKISSKSCVHMKCLNKNL